jgi:hypothetical protein
VLVVAMVLSVFYPAAGAFAAAKKPTLNSTNKYLHLDVEGKNKYNFNINNKQSGWKYYWESADEDIAVVNSKNGVTTATGVGKTKVTVTITDKNKEVVTKLSATVTVRDNIKTVKITNIPEGNKLAVGQENDFNRSFVTVSGSTKKTSAITRWTVDSDKATINDKGVFVANEAGEYTITARSFQSKAKYEDWKKDADTYAKYVLAEDTVKITVAPSIVEVSQVDLETVDVVFDSAMADADKNISVYELIGKAEVKQLVKKVTMSDDKKTATVQLYVPFKAGATYVVKYTDLEPESFVAATTNEEDVAKIDITTSTAVYNEATKVEFKLYNANGVDITTDKLANRVTMKSSEGAGTYFNTTTNELTIFGKNASTTITATYHTYKYDSEGNEVGVVEDEAIIIGVDKDATNITGLKAWTIDKSTAEPTFKDVNQVLALNDNNVRLFVQFNTKTGSKEATINSFAKEGMFDFTSSDKNILIVDNKGNLFPVKEGNVVVVVSYGEGDSKTPIGAISITVHPERTVGVLSLSNTNVVLSNNTAVDDKAEVKISVKDQLGTKMENGDFTYSVEKMSGSPADDLTEKVSNTTGDTIVFSAKDKAVGTYYYKVTVGKKAAVVTVKVLDGNTDTKVAYHKLQLEDTFVDLKVKQGEINKTLGIELFGYNSNGVKVSREVLDSSSDYILKIDSPENKWDESNFDANKNKFTLVKVGEGGAIEKAPKGSYKVTAFEKIDNKEVVLDNVQFSVDDTQVAPVLAEVKNRLFEQEKVDPSNKTNENLIAAVKDCFKFTLNGKDVTDNIVEVVAVGTADEFNVRTVTIKETIIDGAWINHEVKVGLTITKK